MNIIASEAISNLLSLGPQASLNGVVDGKGSIDPLAFRNHRNIICVANTLQRRKLNSNNKYKILNFLNSFNLKRHIRLILLFFLMSAGLALPVLAKSTEQVSRDTTIKLFLSAIISLFVGGLTAFGTTYFKLKEFREQSEIQQKIEKKREEEKNRIQYLNPLRISAEDLMKRLEEIVNYMNDEQEKTKITNNFDYINERNIANRQDFDKWCNIDGYFCMSTIYITILYFSRANKLRAEFPIAQLNPEEDEELLSALSHVRQAFGGRHGIWETIQDSLGSYIKKSDGSLMNYREFCGEIADHNKHIWFRSLIDFYVNYHKKLKDEIPIILPALEELVKVLRDTQTRASNQV